MANARTPRSRRRHLAALWAAGGAMALVSGHGAAASAPAPPPVAGHAQVVAQALVDVDGGGYEWTLTDVALDGAGLELVADTPTFLLADGDGAVLLIGGVTDAQLADGEAAFRDAGTTTVATPADDAIIGLQTLALDVADPAAPAPFTLGASLHDIELVRDILATGETVTIDGTATMFVVVTAGSVADATGSSLLVGESVVGTGALTFTGRTRPCTTPTPTPTGTGRSSSCTAPIPSTSTAARTACTAQHHDRPDNYPEDVMTSTFSLHRAASALTIAGAALIGVAGTSSATGGSSTPPPTTPTTTGSAAGVEYPVTATYAGITWAVTGVEDHTGDNGTVLLVDVSLTNDNPFGMTWPIDALNLIGAELGDLVPDGQEGTGSRRIEVGSGQTVSTALEFEVDDVPDAADLSLRIATTGDIAEIVPFVPAGPPASDAADPVAAEFTGTTPDVLFDADDTATFAAVGATVALDGPGVRAPIGGRLVVVEVLVTAAASNTNAVGIREDDYRLDVGGALEAPVALVETIDNVRGMYPRVAAGTSETVVLVFEIAADDAMAAGPSPAQLVITTDHDSSASLALEVPAIAPCCGE